MPDRMEEMAILTGHLTPGLLEAEIRKMPRVPPRLFITHIKPQHEAEIGPQIAALGRRNIRILRDDMEIVAHVARYHRKALPKKNWVLETIRDARARRGIPEPVPEPQSVD